ncbi:hypothetical protein HDU98_006236 [Podochytrium sp. JEL0797]|nr:hypothetical protein HDU98_006236 [Podochytrium sp. JEL0797]
MTASTALPPKSPTDSLSNLLTAGTEPIVYEVNLSVPKENARAYLQYLTGLTSNVCKTVDGFTGVSVFTQPKPSGLHWLSEEGDSKVYIVVHYRIDSEDHLNSYLADKQDALAHLDQDRWKFLVISRRILRLQF